VIRPAAGGATAAAPEVARQLIAKLDAAAKSGQLGKRKFILDLQGLEVDVQREVLRLLANNPKAAKRAQNILIHDRANSEMMVFDPKDAK
jgi:ribosomal protein L20